MSNYTDNEYSVRVDFFRASGKWYETEAMIWLDYNSSDIIATFRESLNKHLDGRLEGMTAVCLKPYHKNAFPLMVVNL